MATFVELVEVRTADGVPLAGILAGGAASTAPRFDAALLMHGAGNSFYEGFYRNFSVALAARGTATLRANNRGHDIVNRGGESGTLLGTAFESVPDCVLDWRAWLALLAERGYRRTLVFGHSLGAVKTAYVLANERISGVEGCVLASPPRFNTGVMLESERGAEFSATLERARAAVAAGRGGDLIATTFPLQSFSAAAAYLAKYDAGTAFDVLELVTGIPYPVLALVGSEELTDPVFRDYPEGFAAVRTVKGDVEFTVVPDGDHYYSRAQTFATERLLAWIDSLSD